LTQKHEKEIEEIKKSWNGIGAPPIKTKELEFLIKSINGNRDMMNIRNFIETLPIRDSQEFRKYVYTHKPGLELKQVATAPSGEKVEYYIGFGVDFFRPFFGI
jgi:phage regulator Rha-like protein